MNLLDLAVNGDDKWKVWSARTKKPVAVPVKKYAWDTNYTVPADNTIVATKAIVNPEAERYANAPLPKYWDAQGRIHTAYTGKTATREDIGKNLGIEQRIKSDNELKALGSLGALTGRIALEPLDWGLSALEYARGDIGGTDMALSMLPFVSGGLLGLSKLGNRIRNFFDIENTLPTLQAPKYGLDLSSIQPRQLESESLINKWLKNLESIPPSNLDTYFEQHPIKLQNLRDNHWAKDYFDAYEMWDAAMEDLRQKFILPGGMWGEPFHGVKPNDIHLKLTEYLNKPPVPKDEIDFIIDKIATERADIPFSLQEWNTPINKDIIKEHFGVDALKSKAFDIAKQRYYYAPNLFDYEGTKDWLTYNLNGDVSEAIYNLKKEFTDSMNDLPSVPLQDLTFKRGSGLNLSLDELDFGDKLFNNIGKGSKKRDSGIYATPSYNIDKAFGYLKNGQEWYPEFQKYMPHIDGYMQSFKLNPEFIPFLKKADSYNEPWGMTKDRRLSYVNDNIFGVYNYGAAEAINKNRKHPIDEVVLFDKRTIDPSTYETFPVTRLPDGRVARTIPWIDEGKYVAPALLSPFLLRALQREQNERTVQDR